jgi:hypothetical protein
MTDAEGAAAGRRSLPPLDGTQAELLVYTGSEDPAAVTAATGVTPQVTKLQGEPGPIPSRPVRFGMWEVSSDGFVEGVDVDVHVRWMLDAVEPGAEALRALLREHPDWRALVSIYAYMERPAAGFRLPAETVARLAALGTELRVGIIFVTGEAWTDGDVTEARFKAGGQSISSEGVVASDAMADHVAWLLPKAQALRAEVDGPARVVLSWARDLSNAGITLPASAVAGLASRDASLTYILMTA